MLLSRFLLTKIVRSQWNKKIFKGLNSIFFKRLRLICRYQKMEAALKEKRKRDEMEANIAWKREETLNLQEMNEQSAYDRYPAEARFDLRSPKELKKKGFVFANGPETASILKVREILRKREEPMNSFPIDEERERWELFSWNMQCLEVMKVSSAKRILKRLDEQHAKLFKDQISGLEEDLAEKQRFFNSNLHYLIAATDGYEDTLGHSQRVASYSALLTNALGIEEKNFCVNIERGALIHDIGKIGIPESILRKAGSLTKKEKEIIEEHPVLGYEMIKEYDFLKGAARVVLYHHERYDGCGYPYGLAGEEIPLEARIFALVDTLDAITSDRPYSRRKSFPEAYREIEKSQGGQFDPLLVDIFLSIPMEKWQRVKARTQISLPSLTLH